MLVTLLFAIVAFIIGYKLYIALGDTSHDREMTQEEKQAMEEFRKIFNEGIDKAVQDNEITISSAKEAEFPADQREIFDQVRIYNPEFTAEGFLNGAKKAFEIIISAVSNSDQATLSNLVVGQALSAFGAEIEKNKANAQVRKINIVGVQNIEIVGVEKIDSQAYITTKIESEQISWVEDAVSGEIIQGSKTAIRKYVDKWVFAKKINSKSNIWLLVKNED